MLWLIVFTAIVVGVPVAALACLGLFIVVDKLIDRAKARRAVRWLEARRDRAFYRWLNSKVEEHNRQVRRGRVER